MASFQNLNNTFLYKILKGKCNSNMSVQHNNKQKRASQIKMGFMTQATHEQKRSSSTA